jgi:hypothetical protein
MIRRYSSCFNLGHKALEKLFEGVVFVQEKIDGSQFSMKVGEDGLECRSRRVMIDLGNPGIFEKAVQTAKSLESKLEPGFTYRCEFLSEPKHNTLRYSRVPRGYIILFDIDMGDQDYMIPVDVGVEAERLGLEFVPILAVYQSKPSIKELETLLDTESVLGGTKVEGIVLKNYAQFGADKKVLVGKMVRADFQEVHREDWRQRNPPQKAFLERLASSYATEARWQKAMAHLREDGKLTLTPRDIPALMAEVVEDVHEECRDEISQALFEYFWRTISKRLTRGLPEWYKERIGVQ